MRYRSGLWGVGLALLLATAPARAELLVNGGFELPALPPGTAFVTQPPGAPVGWTIDSGSIDLIRDYWPAHSGLQSIDLAGSSAGVISQTFATTAGLPYRFSFAYANNVDVATATGRADILGAGSSILLTTTVTHTGSTRPNMNYIIFTGDFVANSATTTVRFTHITSTIPQFAGLALDSASVQAVPEPTSVALLGIGALGLCLVRRRFRGA